VAAATVDADLKEDFEQRRSATLVAGIAALLPVGLGRSV